MSKVSWLMVLPVILATGVSVKAEEAVISDEKIQKIARQYAFNLSKRDSCSYSFEDLFDSEVKDFRAKLDPQQKRTYDVALSEAENDPEYDMSDNSSADEAWCKEAKEKLKSALEQ